MSVQENAINTEFISAYKALEDYLRCITNFPTWVSIISLYEETLPPEHRKEIQRFRHFRNELQHKEDVATANERWAEALHYELEEVKKNEKKVAGELKKLYDRQKKHTFSFALEEIFKNRRNDEDVMDSFRLFEKLNEKCGFSEKSKEKVRRFCNVDSKVHFFESVMKGDKDLRTLYPELHVDGVNEQEFYGFVKMVEDIVATEQEIDEDEQPAVVYANNQVDGNASTVKEKKSLNEKQNVEKKAVNQLAADESKNDPLKTDNAHIYVKALKFISNHNMVSMTALQRELTIGYLLAGEIMDWLVAQGFVSQEAKRGVGRLVLKSKSTIYKFIRENVGEEARSPKYKNNASTQTKKIRAGTNSKAKQSAPQTAAVSTGEWDASFVIGFIVVGLVLAIGLFITLACSLHWSWGVWQWFVGIIGAILLFVIFIWAFVEGGARVSALGFSVLLNFVLLLIFKGNYKTIFACFSVVELILGVIFTVQSLLEGEGWFILLLLEIAGTLALMIRHL